MRKLMASLLVLVAIIAVFIIYMHRSDNRNLADLPQGVIMLDFEFTNVYLMPINNGYVLIDNAYAHEYERFLQYLNDYNIEITDINYILLTHHHDDHVGFLNQIVEVHQDVRVVLHQKTAQLLRTGLNNQNNGGGIVNQRLFALFKIKKWMTPDWDLSFPPYEVREHDVIIERDVYDLSGLLGIDMKMIVTPGHTSDSVTFIYNDKYAFCGDLASNFLNWAGAHYLTIFNEDTDQVYSSWRKLIGQGVEFLLIAHGKPFGIKNLSNNLDVYDQNDLVPFYVEK